MAERNSGDGREVGRSGMPDDAERRRRNDRQKKNDRSGWNWLLLPAIVIPLLVPVFNRAEPTLFGWPFFYWGQLAMIAFGVLVTSIVYQKTKTRRGPDGDLSRTSTAAADRTGR